MEFMLINVINYPQKKNCFSNLWGLTWMSFFFHFHFSKQHFIFWTFTSFALWINMSAHNVSGYKRTQKKHQDTEWKKKESLEGKYEGKTRKLSGND